MITPSTKLPWSLEVLIPPGEQEEVLAISNGDIVVGELPEELPYFTREMSIKDGEYIIEACNKYPKFIDLLESIEAQSQDIAATRKIREFLKAENIW